MSFKRKSFELTNEQREKLNRLDLEMKQKREHEKKSLAKRQQFSQDTGIPIEYADLDVVKFGKMMGLIKKKTVLEGKEPDNTFSLLNLFFKKPEEPKNIPKGYVNSPIMTSEESKRGYQEELVEKQSIIFSKLISNLIDDEVKNINKVVSINLSEKTLENFKSSCQETMEALFIELEEDDEMDHTEQMEILNIISVIRNSLLGVQDICEFRSLLHDHISQFVKCKISPNDIIQHFSINDARFSLYRNSLNLIHGPPPKYHFMHVIRETQIRHFTKQPELKPFNFDEILKHCCTPSLLYLPIEFVVKYGIVGPFQNNSICHLNFNDGKYWSFYNLKEITSDGLRLWILDNKLWMFTQKFMIEMTEYLIKIFKTFYFECFKTDKFDEKSVQQKHFDVFQNLITNLKFISDEREFHNLILNEIVQNSPLIPTNFDFFNHVKFFNIQISYKNNFVENINRLFPEIEVKRLVDLFCK